MSVPQVQSLIGKYTYHPVLYRQYPQVQSWQDTGLKHRIDIWRKNWNIFMWCEFSDFSIETSRITTWLILTIVFGNNIKFSCVLANVCPETSDEVFALVPSLKVIYQTLCRGFKLSVGRAERNSGKKKKKYKKGIEEDIFTYLERRWRAGGRRSGQEKERLSWEGNEEMERLGFTLLFIILQISITEQGFIQFQMGRAKPKTSPH